MSPNKIDSDIRENDIQQHSPELLSQLLYDHTTGRNLLWCTHDYEHLGENYSFNDEILPELITGEHGMVIRPRVLKTKEEQTDRVKDMAEVFDVPQRHHRLWRPQLPPSLRGAPPRMRWKECFPKQ